MKAWKLLTVCGGLLALAACGSPRSGGNGALPEVNAGLEALAANRGADLGLNTAIDPTPPPADVRARSMAEQAARDLQAGLDLQAVMNRAERKTAPDSTTQGGDADSTSFSLTSAAKSAGSSPAAFVDAPAPAAPAPDLAAKAEEAWAKAVDPVAAPAAAPVRSADDELVELAAKMASLLREPSTRERPRITDAAALAPLEAAHPGAIASLESAGSTLSLRLSDDDRRTLVQAHDRLANGGAVAPSISTGLATFAPSAALRVAKATLCTKVMGFGQYNAYSGTTFAAGSPVPAIVYVEVENFAARPAKDGDPRTAGAALSELVSVDLSQSLTLYQDPSGLQAWHRPAQSVIETSRAQRRDFYLIQQIELPRTLSIGRYNLKVTVKDKSNGQEAEAIIPITIVAR